MNDFEKFYMETKDKFYGYLIKLTGNSEEASDILQETYLRIFEHYREKPIKGLLYRIGYNIFIDNKRKLKHQTNIENVEGREDIAKNTTSSLLIKEEYSSVMAMIQRLSPEERQIISLRTSDNLSYREISQIVGLSEDNIKVKIHRIRKKLKNMLREEGLL